MAGEIFIADKKTLDITKTNTDSIKQDIKSIKQQFPISGGTNWSDYRLVCKRFYVDLDKLQKEYTTIFEINGEGYIDTLLLGHNCSNGYTISAKITVDDTVIYEGIISGYKATVCCGFYSMRNKVFIEHMFKSWVNEVAYFPDMWSDPLPVKPPKTNGNCISANNGGATQAFFNLNKSLFFSKNLKVQVKYYDRKQYRPVMLFLGGVK